jgi:hypothetical protein
VLSSKKQQMNHPYKGAKAMFRKPPSDTITKVYSADSLQQIVVNLDEHQEESLSGGITPIIDPVLIEKMKYPSKRFPCDGPGRGGICT